MRRCSPWSGDASGSASGSRSRWWRACQCRRKRCRPACGSRSNKCRLAHISCGECAPAACLALCPFGAYVFWQVGAAGCRSAIVGNNYDIILIGLVAIFLILRLRAVLGKRTGNERPPARDPFAPPAPPGPPANPPRIGETPSGNDNVIPLPNGNTAARPPLAVNAPGGIRSTVMPNAVAGVAAIRAADPTFEPTGFAGGARAAFTTIVESFAKGETAALKPLLDAQTFASFDAA